MNVNKVLTPVYIYLLVVLVYFGLTEIFEKFVLTNWHNRIFDLLFFILPFFLLFEIVKRKRLFQRDDSYGTTFLFSLIPGFISGTVFGYGWYMMGHGGPLSELLHAVFWPVLIFSTISGLLGLFFDYIFQRMEKPPSDRVS